MAEEKIEKPVQDALLHMQGQVEMLKDGLAISLSLGTLHIPWARPLFREAFRQKTLNCLPGEGKEELEAGYQHMRNRLIELLDETEAGPDYKEFLDEIRKKNPAEIMNEMEKNPKEFLEKLRKGLPL